MSSTRYADADAPFRQERYASSSIYEPGLLGNLVAKRCKAIRQPADRTLVYWLHAQSHIDGGLEAFAKRFLAAFASRIGTPTTRRLAKASGEVYTVAESKAIKEEMPRRPVSTGDFLPVKSLQNPAEYLTWQYFGSEWLDERTGRLYSDAARDELVAEYEAAEAERTRPLPTLTVDGVDNACQREFATLPKHLRTLCLDPSVDLEAPRPAGVWWFEDLIGALHELRRQNVEAARGSIAETTISRKIFAALNYAPKIPMREKLVLIEGDQRTGKTTAAEAWCAMHAGEAVYIRLESGRDISTFYRCVARAIGTASSGQMKAIEMRMKIEDMLQERHLTVVIDEAHFLFPLQKHPESAPDRMDWVRTALVDHGVPVVLVATPQFDRQCALWQKSVGWNAAQIKGRVKLHEQLPTELPDEDLEAVALKMFPQADEVALTRLVSYAQASDDYLAGIERLVCRADYFAKCDGRETATSADIKRAVAEVLPRLENAAPLPEPAKPKRRGSTRATATGKSAKDLGKTLPPALARRAVLNTSADDQTARSGAGERLQFTEEAALD